MQYEGSGKNGRENGKSGWKPESKTLRMLDLDEKRTHGINFFEINLFGLSTVNVNAINEMRKLNWSRKMNLRLNNGLTKFITNNLDWEEQSRSHSILMNQVVLICQMPNQRKIEQNISKAYLLLMAQCPTGQDSRLTRTEIEIKTFTNSYASSVETSFANWNVMESSKKNTKQKKAFTIEY